MEKKWTYKTIISALLLMMISVLLGLFTTSEYVKARGIDYFEHGGQIARHQAVLEGHAGNPWQYRVFAPFLVEQVMSLFKRLGIPYYVTISFIFVRVIQDMMIFLLSYIYYRKLGLPLSHALIGMAILAWGISYSHYDSDLQFNIFFDIIFYLLTGLCILQGKYTWIIPITFLAALNRETSIFIPFLLLSVSLFGLLNQSFSKLAHIFLISFVIYIAVFVGIRLIYGYQWLIIPYGHPPGIELLQYNLFRIVTWRQLIATLSIIPVVALFGYNKWHQLLKVFFWSMVPLWFVIHAFVAVLAETRLLLVPQALVFIPGALYSLTTQTSSLPTVTQPMQYQG